MVKKTFRMSPKKKRNGGWLGCSQRNDIEDVIEAQNLHTNWKEHGETVTELECYVHLSFISTWLFLRENAGICFVKNCIIPERRGYHYQFYKISWKPFLKNQTLCTTVYKEDWTALLSWMITRLVQCILLPLVVVSAVRGTTAVCLLNFVSQCWLTKSPTGQCTYEAHVLDHLE